MPESPLPKIDPDKAAPESAETASHKHHHHRARRRSTRGGMFIVLAMVALILAHYADRIGLIFQEMVHPVAANFVLQGSNSLPIAISIVTAVGLLCLFLLYRGNRPLRFVFGLVSAIAAILYAVILSIDAVTAAASLWIGYDVLALVSAAYASWTCLMSDLARRFFSNQPAAR